MIACSKCLAVKPFDDFGPDKRNKTGRQSQCRACASETSKRSKAKHAEKNAAARKEQRKKHWIANRERLLEEKARYRAARRQELQEKQRAFRSENPEYQAGWRKKSRQHLREYERQRYCQSKARYFAAAAKRRAARTRATPPWFDADMAWAVAQAYELAQLRKQQLGGDWHIDHAVPLRGKNVCGLHVPWNLQVILAEENVSKSNKFIDGQQMLPVTWGRPDNKSRQLVKGRR